MSDHDFMNSKPGDSFAIPLRSYGRGTDRYKKVTVARLTTTQMVMEDGGRWRRESGRKVGDQYAKLEPWTKKHDIAMDRASNEDEAHRLCHKVSDLRHERELIVTLLPEFRVLIKAARDKGWKG